jgi:MoaA/NifB/PqqE/SkfB family radical SAM enzyme
VSELYSQLKPAWHLDQIQSLRAGFIPPPVHVQLVLSDLCNQDCGFCAYRMSSGLSTELFPGGDGSRNPVRRISTEKALEIVEDCARLGVQAIQFTGGGEPTVHRDHLQIFSRAQELGMSTALVTNGIRLEVTHPAVKAMSWIRVSVDAGTVETYARTRGVSEKHWSTVWQKLGWLPISCRGTVSVGFVVTKENYREVALAAGLAKGAGVANIRIGAVFSAEGRGYYGDLLPRIREEIATAAALADDKFQVVDLFDRRIEDLDAGAPTEPLCGYQFLTAYIGGDLGVYRCCNTAYTRHGKVADLTDTSLYEVFSGSRRQAANAFDARSCRFCQFRGQNQVLASMLRKPAHAEFV